MTHALVIQMLEVLESGLAYVENEANQLTTREYKAAITAAREYLATEPSGERVEFEAWCKSVGHSTSTDHVDNRRYWYAETSAAWDAWQASRKASQTSI